MAEGKKEFEGIPSGAAFEAAQRALRELSLDVLDEDHARRQIHAERKKTFWKEYAEIDLQVSEIGQTTEVRVKKSPKSMLDMEGKELVNAILSRVESEIDKIKSDGRISRYSFGQVASAPPGEISPPMRRAKASQSEKAVEKKVRWRIQYYSVPWDNCGYSFLFWLGVAGKSNNWAEYRNSRGEFGRYLFDPG